MQKIISYNRRDVCKIEKYQCSCCGFNYDETFEPIKFKLLPVDWQCPKCGIGKEFFVKVK